MNTAGNVALQVLATGAVADGVTLLKTNLVTGLVLVAVGVALYFIYEYTPVR